MKILVTGGAGYIGTHTCLALIEQGFTPIVVDNFSNSSPLAIKRVEQLSNTSIPVIKADICDRAALDTIFQEHDIQAVMHFAGLKAVGESVAIPLSYYHNNIHGSLNVLQAMEAANVQQFIFSSSATVYGDPASVPIKESDPTGNTTNPYGYSKYVVESLLEDICRANPALSATRLRYFNPVGAHISGQIGEDPSGIPNNLMPFITQVAIGRREKLAIFGDDYPTPDGTGVRDYIHVQDLADGHVSALRHGLEYPGLHTFNLGTGQGISVKEMHRAMEEAVGKCIPAEIQPRRPGDIAQCYADPSKAESELNWRATRSVNDMATDSWRWQSQNPNGYNNA
ncbi:UDP-glucose 4-epimerase GalE [Thaumasiovibrio subtropicus]|uniref:UDP-glucose 4-epimerase GalE n=1 Tax=Thaumasiovibrio subtropicus TaxID=1891207 RepID=UPI000B35C7D8|nr:UDP-glucose 4-epimerase GalE [Thaumasiovibrio subtropicus]